MVITDCIFCKIVSQEIPSYKVYEDSKFLAFLDINPVNNGHTLVIPKKHYENFLDLPREFMGDYMSICQKICDAIIKGLNADGFNILNSSKRAAGQLVDHVHMHIIPRFKNDGLKHWPQHSYKDKEAVEVAVKIKSFL